MRTALAFLALTACSGGDTDTDETGLVLDPVLDPAGISACIDAFDAPFTVVDDEEVYGSLVTFDGEALWASAFTYDADTGASGARLYRYSCGGELLAGPIEAPQLGGDLAWLEIQGVDGHVLVAAQTRSVEVPALTLLTLLDGQGQAVWEVPMDEGLGTRFQAEPNVILNDEGFLVSTAGGDRGVTAVHATRVGWDGEVEELLMVETDGWMTRAISDPDRRMAWGDWNNGVWVMTPADEEPQLIEADYPEQVDIVRVGSTTWVAMSDLFEVKVVPLGGGDPVLFSAGYADIPLFFERPDGDAYLFATDNLFGEDSVVIHVDAQMREVQRIENTDAVWGALTVLDDDHVVVIERTLPAPTLKLLTFGG